MLVCEIQKSAQCHVDSGIVIVKGGINTRASARYEFGLGALSSHAASQSPSTIRGVPAVWEGDIITALTVGWVLPMGAIFHRFM